MAKRGRKISIYRMTIAGLVVRAWRSGLPVNYQGAPGEACEFVDEANYISPHTAPDCFRDYKHIFLDKTDRKFGPMKKREIEAARQTNLGFVVEKEKKIAYLRQRAEKFKAIAKTQDHVVEKQLNRQIERVDKSFSTNH